MAVPKRKASKARTRRRRKINASFNLPPLRESEATGEKCVLHRVDISSGFYRGRKIVELDKKNRNNSQEEKNAK